jgi:predicted nucleic-acid-binding Zn-ribbon protein
VRVFELQVRVFELQKCGSSNYKSAGLRTTSAGLRTTSAGLRTTKVRVFELQKCGSSNYKSVSWHYKNGHQSRLLENDARRFSSIKWTVRDGAGRSPSVLYLDLRTLVETLKIQYLKALYDEALTAAWLHLLDNSRESLATIY